MKICDSSGGWQWVRNWSLLLVLFLGSVGCRSFLANQAMKHYPVKITTRPELPVPNHYQEDFLYLKTLGEEVFPLVDRYFLPDHRAAMEKEILHALGQPNCSHDTFVLSIRRYLSGFNNLHAAVEFNPKPIRLEGVYPFTVQYVSNDLYLANIAREYGPSPLGHKITAINGQAVAEVEEKFFSFMSAENVGAKRISLESFPIPYSSPGFYRLAGFGSSPSNSIQLEFASHPSLAIAPMWKGPLQWQEAPPPPHPITARAKHQYDCRMFPEQNFAYLQFNACFDKTAILDGLNMVKPWMRPLVRAWLELQFHRKKPAAVLKGIYDPERPVFKDYLAKSIREINQQGITNLIIDLRRNRGGEGELVKQLIYHLTDRTDLLDARGFQYNLEAFAHYDPKGSREFHSWYRRKFGAEPISKQLLPMPEQEQLFFARVTDPKSRYYVPPDRPVFSGKVVVLANQHTGSAASDLTGLLQDNGLAVVVGTTTGSNLTGPTGMTPLQLPHSKMMVSLPTVFFERAQPSKGESLQPDFWVEDTVGDVRAGRDPALEKALELFVGE